MSKKQAINMAIKALEERKRGLAFDANVYKRFSSKVSNLYPKAGKAHMEYAKIEQAIKILYRLVNNGEN